MCVLPVKMHERTTKSITNILKYSRLLISISAFDSDTIGNTFKVSLFVSAKHLCGSIGIGDSFLGGIASISDDTFSEYR